MAEQLTRPWTDEVVYMILIDRFFRAGAGAEPVAPFMGGNLAGVRAKLDYLQELEINTL